MIACYRRDARFRDPVFGELDYERIAGMWRMLCERAHDLELELGEISSSGEAVVAHWNARYTFGKTGRKVHNRIISRFIFKDDLIAEQLDRFSLWRWSRMALGPAGVMLGWSFPIRSAIRRGAQGDLARYLEKRA